MPVAFDAAAQKAQTSTLSAVASMTVASGACLIVGIFSSGSAGRSVSSVAANGTSLTQLGRVENDNNITVHFFGLTAAPSGVVSISANIVGTAFAWGMQCASYTGQKAANCFGTVVSGTAGTVTNVNMSISSTTNDIVVGLWACNTDMSATNGTTRLSNGAFLQAILVDIAGATQVSLSATLTASGNVAFLGFSILFSAAAATGIYTMAQLGCGQ